MIGSSDRITAIVPVYNEERTVGYVVERLLNSPAIDQVICVDDGSTDGSLAVLEQFGSEIELVPLPANYGKGYALSQGVRRAEAEVVVFIDADLVNLDGLHVWSLIDPMHEDGIRATVGIPGGDQIYSATLRLSLSLAQRIGRQLSGQRAYYRADLLPHLDRMEPTRFGIEVFLNGLIPGDQTRVVVLHDLLDVAKQDKHGPRTGAREYAGATYEVALQVGRRGLARPSWLDSIRLAND